MRKSERERERQEQPTVESKIKKEGKLTKVLSKPKSIDRKSKKNCPSVD